MQPQHPQFGGACARPHSDFFAKFPNDDLRDRVGRALALLLKRQTDFPGDPGGWAGGTVFALGSHGYGVPGVLNPGLEEAFSAKMTTIRKREAQVMEGLGDDAPLSIESVAEPPEFTLRDEANAICAYAFRNGPIEDVHAHGRVTDDEMERLMVTACERLAKLLAMKRDTPTECDRFIRDYGRKYCYRWET